MSKRKLVLIEEKEGEWTYRGLSYVDVWHEDEIADHNSQPTLEELADFLDSRAESTNAHDFVGTHRALAVILFRAVGREQATAIMREVAEWSGLEELKFVLEDGRLGVLACWTEWELKDGE